MIDWELLPHQVRVSGDVVRIAQEEAEAYVAGRPRRSQSAAMTPPQGRTIVDRAAVEDTTVELATRFPDAVPLPSFWGRYRLRPRMFESSQGRRDLVHDRFRDLRDEAAWRVDRLAP